MNTKEYVYQSVTGETEYGFSDNLKITDTQLKEIAKSAIKTICDKLPEEARRTDVVEEVLKLAKKDLYAQKINL